VLLSAFFMKEMKCNINLEFLTSFMKLEFVRHFTLSSNSTRAVFSVTLFSSHEMKFKVIEISLSLFTTSWSRLLHSLLYAYAEFVSEFITVYLSPLVSDQSFSSCKSSFFALFLRSPNRFTTTSES